MTRKDILDAALKCVNGDRDQSYGNPEDSFLTIARLWNAYISAKSVTPVLLSSSDVAAMLALLKIARIAGGVYKADNWIDLAGYAACGGEVESPRPEEEPKPVFVDNTAYDTYVHNRSIPDHPVY